MFAPQTQILRYKSLWDFRYAISLDMCDALDMPCGARGIYIDLIASRYIERFAVYRMGNPYIEFAERIYRQRGVYEQQKNQLREESICFAIQVSDICDTISGNSVYINQLLRSSSSIGANLHEAKYAQSRADFIHKLEIALKECSETEYWLELLFRKNKLTELQYSKLKNTCGTIRRKLIASVTTAKANTPK